MPNRKHQYKLAACTCEQAALSPVLTVPSTGTLGMTISPYFRPFSALTSADGTPGPGRDTGPLLLEEQQLEDVLGYLAAVRPVRVSRPHQVASRQ